MMIMSIILKEVREVMISTKQLPKISKRGGESRGDSRSAFGGGASLGVCRISSGVLAVSGSFIVLLKEPETA